MASAAGKSATKKVYYEGWLDKKSPAGIRGFRKWQKRWFQIQEKAIIYMKNQGDEKHLGQIPLNAIVDCEYLPDKRIGCRFDIRVKNLRVYSLNGDTIDGSKAWVAAVKENVNRFKAQNDSEKGGSGPKDSAVKLTKLQALLLRAKSGVDVVKAAAPVAEQKAMQNIKMQYPTDADVLAYILHVIMDYKNGHFNFDMTDEKDDTLEAEDIKVDEKTGVAVAPPSSSSSSSPSSSTTSPSSTTGGTAGDGGVAVRNKCRIDPCNAVCKTDTDYCEWHQSRKPKAITTAPAKAGMNPMMAQMAARAGGAAAAGAAAGAGEGKGATMIPLKAEEIKGILDMLNSKEFIRHLCGVFITADRTAHGLAVRILWCLFRGTMNKTDAAKEFAQFMEIHCSGLKFNLDIKNALLAILLQTPAKVVSTIDKLTVSFYMPVHNPSTWQALLNALKTSDFATRKAALEDVNTILHDNFENCRSLRRNATWQSWVYDILTDVPKNKNADPILKTVFAYCINVVTLIHYQYFMKKPYFAEVLTSSLYRLHNFAGSSSECQRVGGTMLAALASKLAAQHKNFSSDKDAVDWKNLYALTRIVRKFVFQSSWWQSNSIVWEETKVVVDQPGTPLALASPTAASRTLAAPSPAKAVKKGEEGFVLSRARLAKNDRTFDDSPLEITDHGLHWTDDGKGADVALVVKVADLFKALRIHEYNPDLNPNMAAKEKEFIQNAVREFEFWEDCKKFIEIIVRDDIEERRLLSYRKMSFLCEEWLAAGRSRSARQSTLADMENIIKDRAKADARAAGKKEATAKSQSVIGGAIGLDGGPASPTGAAAAAGFDDGPASPRGTVGPVSDMATLPPHLRQLAKQMSSLGPTDRD